jgi:hypothetical protein
MDPHDDFERYLNARFAGVKLNGYLPDKNPTRNYKTAKIPPKEVTGFTSEDYLPPSIDECISHEEQGGFMGWRLPPGLMVVDNEDPDTMAEIERQCQKDRPPTQKTTNGKQWTFRCNGDIRGADGVYTRTGLKVTYRLPMKNYVILPPTNGRTWEYVGSLETPPPLPDALLSYRKDNKADLLNCISWEVHRLKKADTWGGYEQLLSLSTFMQCLGIEDDVVRQTFKVVFGKEYDPRQTEYFITRNREKLNLGEPVIGAGTLFDSLKTDATKNLRGFLLCLEKVLKPKQEKAKGKEKADEKREAYCACFPGLIDVVVDEKGIPSYLVKNGNDLHLSRSHEMDGTGYIPPGKEHLPYILPRADQVKRWYREDNDEKLFEDTYQYLSRFSYVDPDYKLLLAAYVFATYIQEHPDLYYLAEIVFYAPPEYGKSRTGKAMTSIAYRGIHLVDLREPNVFRYSQNLQATLFFDTKSLWKKAEKSGSEDLLLLRFEKGAKASRVIYPERGPFRDTVYYDIFGPTIIATNEAIHNILDTRAITVPIPNKPGQYENLHPLKGLELRERLTAWRVRMMEARLPKIEPIHGVQGRLYDITEPLLQVCALVHPGSLSAFEGVIQEVAGKRRQDKLDTTEGQIVVWLKDNAPASLQVWEQKTSELIEWLNADRPDKFKVDGRYVGKKLNSMGIITRKSHGTSTMVVRRSAFDDLVYAYQGGNSPHSPNAKTPETIRDARGSVGSEGLFTPPAQTVENKGDGEYGEYGESGEDFVHEADNEETKAAGDKWSF